MVFLHRIRSSAPRGSRKPIVFGNIQKEGLPTGEDEDVAGDAEMIPEVLLAPQLLPEPLVRPVGQLEDLMEDSAIYAEIFASQLVEDAQLMAQRAREVA